MLSFFFTPQENANGYFNLETNCIGTILKRHHGAENSKQPLDISDLDKITMATSLPKKKLIEPEITEPTVWTLEYALPWRMLAKYRAITPLAPGTRWRANFYKCGDKTSHPHWLTWSKIPMPKPTFHQPQYFGFLEFTE